LTGLLGGAFDPPHVGHVALADAAERQLGLGDLVVVVVADPGHKEMHCPVETRLALAQAAFPGRRVEVDRHPRTVDMLRDGS
jgi:nicotinate-nucleotide adenylyltransferase